MKCKKSGCFIWDKEQLNDGCEALHRRAYILNAKVLYNILNNNYNKNIANSIFIKT